MDTLHPHESRVSLDEKWYQRFEAVAAFQAYEYLDGDKDIRAAQKKAFLDGAIKNPTLDYPKIDLERLVVVEEALVALQQDIDLNETNDIVKQVYRWRINEKIGELRVLNAAANGNMRRFKRYSEFVYGTPSPEVFAYTVQNLRNTIEQHLNLGDSDVIAAARDLKAILPVELSNRSVGDLPSSAEVTAVHTQTLVELRKLLPESLHLSGEKLDAQNIKTIFDQALLNLQADGWTVVLDTSSKTGISVDQEKKTVKIPESRQAVFAKVQTLVAHEIGTHVARRLNGERSSLQLLGLGLDRYERGEEGVATAREQALSGPVTDFAGLEGHLAISLAYGLDGQPRDFRGVHDILVKYHYLKALVEGKKSDEAMSSAQTSAWNRAVRTFRGTDCATPGVCFTKDIIYREGNIGVWDVVKTNPAELIRFSVGKYDPTNDRHIWVLDQLGITNEDLDGSIEVTV